MTTFDHILPQVTEALRAHAANLAAIGRIVVNRDLNGRVRLIVQEKIRMDRAAMPLIQSLAEDLARRLGPHAYPAERGVLFEESLEFVLAGSPAFALEEFPNVHIVDRLATEGDWTSIAPVSEGAPRIVFFSIKGGVGRSTALAASAWALAQMGRRVLVLAWTWSRPGSPPPCCPRAAVRPMALPTGSWRIWSITAKPCSKI